MAIHCSNRLHWQTTPNELSQAMADAKADGSIAADLTVSNPFYADFEYPEDQIAAALADADACSYSPAANGLATAREAVAAYYAERGREVSPDDVVICSSTSEAYSWLFKLLADPGHSILAPEPSYPLFDDLVALEGLRLKRYAATYSNGWQTDFDALERAALPSVRATLLVNPNNPTGHTVAPDERAQWFELDKPLIVDEVFLDYASTGFDCSFAGDHRGVSFVLSGLSKVCALPNLKLGWIVIQGPEQERRELARRIEWIADSYLSTNTVVQQALPRLLELGAGMRDQIQSRLNENRRILNASGLNVLRSDGGWYAILQLPQQLTDEEWTLRILREGGVAVHPGYFYDMPMESCIVLSLLSAPQQMQCGIKAIFELAT